MKINNNIQSFSNLNGIKVNQKSNTNQEINQNKTVKVSINKNTLNSLDLLNSLEQKTFLNSFDNSYVNKDREAIDNKLKEHYQKTHLENLSFPNPSFHIYHKYHNPKYPYFAKEMNSLERQIARDTENAMLDGRKPYFRYDDYVVKDMKSDDGLVDGAKSRAYYRDKVNNQFEQLLNRYGIEIPKDVSLTFTIEPYDFKATVTGTEDNTLITLIEDAINTADNSKELFFHIRRSVLGENSQLKPKESRKYSVFHEIKNKTGYDLRDLELKDGKFLTENGEDIIKIYAKNISKIETILPEFKSAMLSIYTQYLDELAQEGFENSPDLMYSIEYKNKSFYDIGQSKNFGVGKREWIDKLEASSFRTLKDVYQTDKLSLLYYDDKQALIKEELNLDEFTKNGINKDLLEEYETLDPELIKLILMQKYLFGKDDEETKKFYKMLKEWEEFKREDFS